MLSDPTYWKVVAKGIDVEDEKIDIFVPDHKHSRGIAREAILRSLLVAQTPHPFVVSTGFVYDESPYANPAKQCDVLVYDPRDGQPYYRLNEFVVTFPKSTRIAVEVKSRLDAAEFADLAKAKSTFCRPMFGFAFDGINFDTFCKYLAAEVIKRTTEDGVKRGLRFMPECIAVHRQNYVGVRATHWRTSVPNECYLAIDFNQVQNPCAGSATAYFMAWYDDILRHERLTDGEVHNLFNVFEGGARVVIFPDGTMKKGGAAVA